MAGPDKPGRPVLPGGAGEGGPGGKASPFGPTKIMIPNGLACYGLCRHRARFSRRTW